MATPSAPVRLSRAEAKARTREGVLAAAEVVFSREGYHGASLARIAAEAGFTTGAVYSTFESKADVMLELLARRAEARRGFWEETLEAAPSVEGFIADLARRTAAEISAEREWWAVVVEFQTLIGRDDALRSRYAKLHEATQAALAAAIRTWLQRLKVRPPLPAEQLATVVVALNRGLALEGLISPDTVTEGLILEAQMILLAGVRGGEDAGR